MLQHHSRALFCAHSGAISGDMFPGGFGGGSDPFMHMQQQMEMMHRQMASAMFQGPFAHPAQPGSRHARTQQPSQHHHASGRAHDSPSVEEVYGEHHEDSGGAEPTVEEPDGAHWIARTAFASRDSTSSSQEPVYCSSRTVCNRLSDYAQACEQIQMCNGIMLQVVHLQSPDTECALLWTVVHAC